MTGKKHLFIIGLLLTGAVFLIGEHLLQADLTYPRVELESIEKSDREAEPVEVELISEINEIEAEELKKIDGIGEVLSLRIEEAMPITTKRELLKVEGIGEVTAKKVVEFVKNYEQYEGEDKTEEESEEEIYDEGEEGKVKLTEEQLKKVMEAALNYDKREPVEEVDEAEDDEKIEEERVKKEVDINKAEAEDLERLDGIGPVYAQRIIENRPFCDLYELLEVSGIGEVTIENIKNQGLATVNECEKEEKEKEKEDDDDKDEEKTLKIEELEEKISALRDDYYRVRGSLRTAEDKLEEETKRHDEELISVKKQRDKCRFKEQININEASEDQLKKVDGIGEVTAKKVVEFLTENSIDFIEELKAVDGIGEGRVENIIESGFCIKQLEEEEEEESDEGEDDEDECDESDEEEEEEEEEEIKNLLKNELFEKWGSDNEKPVHWEGSHSFSTNWVKSSKSKTGNYSVKVKGGGERILRQRLPEKMDVEQTYRASVKVKGTGKIRLGIIYPSGHHNYKDKIELSESDWKVISHEATTTSTPGDKGGLAIKTIEEGGADIKNTLRIDKAQLFTTENPN